MPARARILAYAHYQPRAKRRLTFITLGVCLVALAVASISAGSFSTGAKAIKLFLGMIFFAAIIAGIVLNTIFLVREIRRNEQHDSFINAVTHELKTPIASIRLYLETLQTPRSGRGAAPRILPTDAARHRPPAGHGRAGTEGRRPGKKAAATAPRRIEFGSWSRIASSWRALAITCSRKPCAYEVLLNGAAARRSSAIRRSCAPRCQCARQRHQVFRQHVDVSVRPRHSR